MYKYLRVWLVCVFISLPLSGLAENIACVPNQSCGVLANNNNVIAPGMSSQNPSSGVSFSNSKLSIDKFILVGKDGNVITNYENLGGKVIFKKTNGELIAIKVNNVEKQGQAFILNVSDYDCRANSDC